MRKKISHNTVLGARIHTTMHPCTHTHMHTHTHTHTHTRRRQLTIPRFSVLLDKFENWRDRRIRSRDELVVGPDDVIDKALLQRHALLFAQLR